MKTRTGSDHNNSIIFNFSMTGSMHGLGLLTLVLVAQVVFPLEYGQTETPIHSCQLHTHCSQK